MQREEDPGRQLQASGHGCLGGEGASPAVQVGVLDGGGGSVE